MSEKPGVWRDATEDFIGTLLNWRDATEDMVGKQVLAQFRDGENRKWTDPVKGILERNSSGEWSTTSHGWYRHCRCVLVVPAKAEEPKTEASKAATDDGWRDAVWPDDWGMIAKNEDCDGILVGFDPISESNWLISQTDGTGGVAWCKTCKVITRLPRFVMPGGGK